MVEWPTFNNYNANIVCSKITIVKTKIQWLLFMEIWLDGHASTLDGCAGLVWMHVQNYTIQILTNIINVKHLLYSYANVMQQLDNSSCRFFTRAYAIDITFKFNIEKSTYNVPQMQSHLHNNINYKTTYPFPKYSHSNTL